MKDNYTADETRAVARAAVMESLSTSKHSEAYRTSMADHIAEKLVPVVPAVRLFVDADPDVQFRVTYDWAHHRFIMRDAANSIAPRYRHGEYGVFTEVTQLMRDCGDLHFDDNTIGQLFALRHGTEMQAEG